MSYEGSQQETQRALKRMIGGPGQAQLSAVVVAFVSRFDLGEEAEQVLWFALCGLRDDTVGRFLGCDPSRIAAIWSNVHTKTGLKERVEVMAELWWAGVERLAGPEQQQTGTWEPRPGVRPMAS